VAVPLDWDRPRGRTITLAVVGHLASRPGERIGSLFVNPGGPGDPGVAMVLDGVEDPVRWMVEAAVGRYLVDLTTPAPGTVCPSDRQPVP
jgi:hypothetical protein